MKLNSPCLLVISMMALCATPALAQNLIENSAFNTDFSGWTGAGSGWVADDCCGDPASGSVMLREFGALVSNCIEVTAGTSYDFTLWSKFDPIIQPPESNGNAWINWSTETTCSSWNSFDPIPGFHLGSNAEWQRVGATFVAPVGAQRVQVLLWPSVCGISCGGITYYDNVAFGPAGTVPVELQSFEIN